MFLVMSEYIKCSITVSLEKFQDYIIRYPRTFSRFLRTKVGFQYFPGLEIATLKFRDFMR